MMGVEVCDPDHVEGDIERLPGLGLLPITTTMSGEKVTRKPGILAKLNPHPCYISAMDVRMDISLIANVWEPIFMASSTTPHS